jgi:beta-lactam-binding protein with PASTA domain
MTINDATVLVESLGLKLEVTAGLEAGTVLLFEPAAGTYLARGMTVRVTSGGSGAGGEILGDAIMPNVVGLSVAQTNATLDSMNMTGPRLYSCGEGSVSADPGSGTVLSQSVGAGSQVWSYVGIRMSVACGAGG